MHHLPGYATCLPWMCVQPTGVILRAKASMRSSSAIWLFAITVYRIAHQLYEQGIPLISRIMTSMHTA